MNILVIIGASIVVLLGCGHMAFTLQSTARGGPLAPTDPEVRAAMLIPGGLGMAPGLKRDLWTAWLGFNFSHALGVIAVGSFIGIPAMLDFTDALTNTWWVVMTVVLLPLYLLISVRYWFRKPTIGISLATAMILTGMIGGLA